LHAARRRLARAIALLASASLSACLTQLPGSSAGPPETLPAVSRSASEAGAPGLPLTSQIRTAAVYDFAAVPPYLYAYERGMLRVLDVTDPLAVREVGALEVRPPRVRMMVRGQYLYMRGFNTPVAVIDISSPAAPRLAGELRDVVPTGGRSLCIAGDLALVVRSDAPPVAVAASPRFQPLRLELRDLARDPLAPPLLSSVDLGVRAAGEFGALTHADGRAYVLVAQPHETGGRSELVVVDVRDSARPRVERRVHFPAGRLYRNLEVRGDLLYVTQSAAGAPAQNGLSIWRLPPAGELEALGTATNAMIRFPMDLLLHGDVAYLTVKGVPTFVTIDIADPRAPRIVHSHVENENWAGGLGMARHGNRLYVTGDQGPAGFFDISVPDAPRHLGGWFNGGATRQVLRTGDLVIVQSMTALLFYRVSDPTAAAGRHEAVPLYWAGGVYQTHIVAGASGDRAVAAYETIPAEVIDIADPSHPVVVGRFEPRGLVHAVAVTPERAFLGYRAPAPHRSARPFDPASLSPRGGIEVLDLTDPAAPRTLHDVALEHVVTDLALQGDRLVAAHADGGITVARIDHTGRPTVLARIAGTGAPAPPVAIPTGRVALSCDGRLAFVSHAVLAPGGDPYGDGTGTLTIIDLADPARPRVRSRLEFQRLGDTSVPAVSHGSRVAVLMGAMGGLILLDVSDPADPVLLAREPLPAATYAEGLAMDDAHVYVGAWEDGVLVYALPPDGRLHTRAECR
jgi:hypothetical protein